MYQRFDQGFVGLIFSVFNTTPATQEQTVQLTAFQAVQGAAAAGQQQQQLEGCCSSDFDGLDEQMKAALAASAAGALRWFEGSGALLQCGFPGQGCELGWQAGRILCWCHDGN